MRYAFAVVAWIAVAGMAAADPGWIRRVTDITPPLGGGNAMAYDSLRSRTVWVRGDQTWEWNGSDWAPRGTFATSRNGHAMVYDSMSAWSILYGGAGDNADTWLWDGSEWSRTTAVGPHGKLGHAMAFDALRHRVVHFGGRDSWGVPQNYTWEWIGAGWIPRFSFHSPSARFDHAMAYDSFRGRVVLFGGIDTIARGDTWEWDGTRWWLREATGPSPRSGHAMAFDSIRRRVVLFGGHDENEAPLGDTWEWDGFEWRLRTTVGPDSGRGHAMAYDSRRGRIVLFGQSANVATWELPSSDFYVAPGEDPEQPEVPIPPVPSQRNLLLITHGAGTSRGSFQADWAPLAGRIQTLFGAGDWQVFVYDWSPPILFYPPGIALALARHHARALGSRTQWSEFDHVHLVAHSAGSRLIAELARIAKTRNPAITVHSTYLDAYAGVTWLDDGVEALSLTYGRHSDHAEQYFSREGGVSEGCFPTTYTGVSTQIRLMNAINVDVSSLDPGYTFDCQSTHWWPVCFWRFSASPQVGSGSPCVAGPTGPYAPWGYPLGLENWHGGGGASAWLAFLDSWCPPNGAIVRLHNTDLTVETRTEREDVYSIRTDGILQFAPLPHATSDNGSIVINGARFDADTTHGTAWINVEITTTEAVNFVKYEALFGSVGAEGLLSVYVDNTLIDIIDERFADDETNGQTPMLEADLQPGTHIISFRLDQFGGVVSRASISNLATGWAGFVPSACAGDSTDDGEVNFADITAALTNWGFTYPESTGPGDANDDGVVNFADITSVLTNWGSPCQ